MANGVVDAGKHMFDDGVNYISIESPQIAYHYEHPPQRFSNVGFESVHNAFVPGGYGNWSTGGSGNINMQQYYPLPKSDKVCLVFAHTGFCSFASGCRFRHPTPENAQVDQEENNEIPSENESENSTPIIPCKFYPTGFCKNGEMCKYDHNITEFKKIFNIMGLPYRLGVQDCSFYMRNMSCGFGRACKYHHPDPIFYSPPEAYEEYFQYGYGNSGVTDGGFCMGFSDPNQGYYPQPPMIGGNSQPNFSWNGQQESPYYRQLRASSPVLNDVGLPLRPGKKVCKYYDWTGHCKYGSMCAFDHPPKLSSDVGEASTSMSAPDATTPKTDE